MPYLLMRAFKKRTQKCDCNSIIETDLKLVTSLKELAKVKHKSTSHENIKVFRIVNGKLKALTKKESQELLSEEYALLSKDYEKLGKK